MDHIFTRWAPLKVGAGKNKTASSNYLIKYSAYQFNLNVFHKKILSFETKGFFRKRKFNYPLAPLPVDGGLLLLLEPVFGAGFLG